MKPEISVIIPTYNRAHVLKRAMDSVLAQVGAELELIIVDDCSTDHTQDLVAGYTDERVKYIRMEQNGGPAKARNLGVTYAMGDYIAFQDSDDEWCPLKLQKQLQIFKTSQTDIGMVYCYFCKKFPNKEVVYPPEDVPMEQKSGQVFGTLLYSPLVGTPTMLIPRRVWIEMNGFTEGLRCFEDWELTMRIAQKYPIILVDEVLVTVYQSENSLIMDGTSAISADFYIYQKFYEYYKTDEMKKEKLNRISQKVRTLEEFEAYRQGIQRTMGVKI